MTDWPYMIFDAQSGNAVDAYPNWWRARWALLKLRLRYRDEDFVLIGPHD